tara:strand:- start:9 stop:644 length:636 start_codon:yes stop_codon:yes gene_type:complete
MGGLLKYSGKGGKTPRTDLLPLGRYIIGCTFLMLAVVVPGSAVAVDESALWAKLRAGGHIVLMRHALAPGIGDTEKFTLDDCATQRNLSDTGRVQPRRIGDWFRENRVDVTRVFSSQWCRCEESAELFGLGSVTPLPALNSFFQRTGRRGRQTDAMREWLVVNRSSGTLVFVNHQVNISALTDQYTASGETKIARVQIDGRLDTVGSIETD